MLSKVFEPYLGETVMLLLLHVSWWCEKQRRSRTWYCCSLYLWLIFGLVTWTFMWTLHYDRAFYFVLAVAGLLMVATKRSGVGRPWALQLDGCRTMYATSNARQFVIQTKAGTIYMRAKTAEQGRAWVQHIKVRSCWYMKQCCAYTSNKYGSTACVCQILSVHGACKVQCNNCITAWIYVLTSPFHGECFCAADQ